MNTSPIWVLTAAVGVAVATNLAPHEGGGVNKIALADDSLAQAKSSPMLREGATLPDVVGTFRIVGDRVHFAARDGRTFRCLENLMLQRVHQIVSEDSNELIWIVNGRVTEFRNENYLLVEVVRRAK